VIGGLRRAIQAGILAVVVLIWVAYVSNPLHFPGLAASPPTYWLKYALPGSAFATAGLIAWWLRPRNRVGVLMVGVGFGLLIGVGPHPAFQSPISREIENALFNWGPPRPGLFLSLGSLWVAMLFQLLLAFPGGHLTSRLSRWLVTSLYVFVPLIGVLEAPGGYGLDQSLPVWYAPQIASLLYVASPVLAIALILRRWLLGGLARRRSLSPVLWALAPITFALLPWTLMNLLVPIIGKPQSGPVSSVIPTLATVSPLLLAALPIGFLVGLLRSGLDMTSVASLVVKLSSGLLPEQLQSALAQALHDPSLRVAYWVPALDSFADLEGRPLDLPTPGSERAVSILDDATNPIAALIYDASLLHEPQLVDTAAAGVWMALENARLQVQLRAQLEEVQQSRARLVDAGQRERQRVERDLHDGAQQQLVTLLLSLQVTKAEAIKHADPKTAALLEANTEALKQALFDLRELARGIHPSILTEAGLIPAIRSLCERSPIQVEVRGDLCDGRLAPSLEATLYFVAAEAITNAVKHSRATHICVSLQRVTDRVVLEIADDGRGGADISAGTGLRGLSDRVAAVGGQLQVESDSGGGTRIHTEIPSHDG